MVGLHFREGGSKEVKFLRARYAWDARALVA